MRHRDFQFGEALLVVEFEAINTHVKSRKFIL